MCFAKTKPRGTDKAFIFGRLASKSVPNIGNFGNHSLVLIAYTSKITSDLEITDVVACHS